MLSFYIKLPIKRILPEVKYDYHPVRWYTLRPNQKGYTYGAPFQVDKEGFRQNLKDDHDDFSHKLIGLGDSFTFGMGVADNETWPAQLEVNLNNGDTVSYAVINAGIVGYGTFQINDLIMEKNLLVDADLVIYALYWNDYMNTSPPKPDAVSKISKKGYFRWDPVNKMDADDVSLKRWLVDNSILISMLRDLRNSFEEPSPYSQSFNNLINGVLIESNFKPIEDFIDNMQRQQNMYGYKFIVVILPVYNLLGMQTNYDETIRKILEKKDIKYFDAFSIFDTLESTSDYFLSEKVDVHLNPRGYKVLSDGLYQMLIDNNMFE